MSTVNELTRRNFLQVVGLTAGTAALAACGGNQEATPAEPEAEDTEAEAEAEEVEEATSGASYKIGILQYVQHEALDASHDGFLAALDEAGIDYEVVDDLNGSADQAACQTAAQTIVNDGVDLVLAIATPAVEAVAGVTEDIPIVGTAVTDFAESGLIDSNDAPGGNITGSSDLTPVAEQFELLATLFPDATNVGVLYCSAESNSEIQAQMAHDAADEHGLTATDYTVSNTNEIQSVVESAVGKIDVLYCPTDNTIASGMATVAQVCIDNDLPTVVGEVGMVENGGLVSYSIDYYELGKRAGDMAVDILVNGADPASMAIEHLAAEECTLEKNEETAAALGVDLSVLD